LPTTRYRFNLDVWALVQSRGDGQWAPLTRDTRKGYWASIMKIWFDFVSDRQVQFTWTQGHRVNHSARFICASVFSILYFKM